MSIAFQRDVNMIYASKAIAKNGKMKKSKTSKEALSSFILKKCYERIPYSSYDEIEI